MGGHCPKIARPKWKKKETDVKTRTPIQQTHLNDSNTNPSFSETAPHTSRKFLRLRSHTFSHFSLLLIPSISFLSPWRTSAKNAMNYCLQAQRPGEAWKESLTRTSEMIGRSMLCLLATITKISLGIFALKWRFFSLLFLRSRRIEQPPSVLFRFSLTLRRTVEPELTNFKFSFHFISCLLDSELYLFLVQALDWGSILFNV